VSLTTVPSAREGRCGNSSVVERNLAKVEAVSSTLTFRSIIKTARFQKVHGSAKHGFALKDVFIMGNGPFDFG
jgi:hypothetical protein